MSVLPSLATDDDSNSDLVVVVVAVVCTNLFDCTHSCFIFFLSFIFFFSLLL